MSQHIDSFVHMGVSATALGMQLLLHSHKVQALTYEAKGGSGGKVMHLRSACNNKNDNHNDNHNNNDDDNDNDGDHDNDSDSDSTTATARQRQQ